jgi:hypothetical protein
MITKETNKEVHKLIESTEKLIDSYHTDYLTANEEELLHNTKEALKEVKNMPKQEIDYSVLTDYDIGLINYYGGGDVGWWMDYLRSEVDAANEHWRQQLNCY